MAVLGVDGCKKGWAGILLGEDGQIDGVFAPSLDRVLARARSIAPVDVVAIDIPIGLPDAGRRHADGLARSLLGPRASSVFTTPTRAAITAPTYPEAAERNRELAGQGLSKQAFALAPRILEADTWVRTADVAAIEVHPEVSFVTMASGTPLGASKHTWTGATLRRRILADAGVLLPDDLGEVGVLASVDDVHDAAAAAWTARRYRDGDATPVPDPPEVFSDGWPCAIWA